MTTKARHAAWRCCVLAATLGIPGWAQAQVGGSLVLVSDHRFRGVSLSNERPDLQLTLSYDHPGGAYAGASVGGVEFEDSQRLTRLLAYAGLTCPLGDTLRWDIGTSFSHAPGDARYDYGEAYAGLIAQHWRLYANLSPDYFGSGARTAYVGLDAGWPLAGDGHLLAHLGVLRRLDSPSGGRADARFGVGWAVAGGDLQLAWVGVQRGGPFAAAYDQRRSALVLSASYAF